MKKFILQEISILPYWTMISVKKAELFTFALLKQLCSNDKPQKQSPRGAGPATLLKRETLA